MTTSDRKSSPVLTLLALLIPIALVRSSRHPWCADASSAAFVPPPTRLHLNANSNLLAGSSSSRSSFGRGTYPSTVDVVSWRAALPGHLDDEPICSRRDAFIVATAAVMSAPLVAHAEATSTAVDAAATTRKDDDGGRLIEFTVANLDGVEGETGSFVIRTHPSWAPRGVERFEELTEKSFWDDCRIFRVLPGFVSQFGINGKPDVQAFWRSRNIQDDPVKESNRRGTVVFATAGKNTRTTQLFINTGDRNSFLDNQGFSPIGEVVEGMNVVDRFYSGYGEGAPQGRGPSQALMQAKGADYVNNAFPKLSYFTKAVFVDKK